MQGLFLFLFLHFPFSSCFAIVLTIQFNDRLYPERLALAVNAGAPQPKE
jgi:hypothetical protein